jgi:hypothetical protein
LHSFKKRKKREKKRIRVESDERRIVRALFERKAPEVKSTWISVVDKYIDRKHFRSSEGEREKVEARMRLNCIQFDLDGGIGTGSGDEDEGEGAGEPSNCNQNAN